MHVKAHAGTGNQRIRNPREPRGTWSQHGIVMCRVDTGCAQVLLMSTTYAASSRAAGAIMILLALIPTERPANYGMERAVYEAVSFSLGLCNVLEASLESTT